MGSGKWEVGSGKWEMGNGKWEMGSGKWEVGSGKWEVNTTTNYQLFGQTLNSLHIPNRIRISELRGDLAGTDRTDGFVGTADFGK